MNTHLPNKTGKVDLENLVEAKFESTLHGVSQESWCPPSGQCSDSFFLKSQLCATKQIFVLDWINLHV